MRQHSLLAEFRGHKIGNKYKTIIRFYDDKMQPWKVLAYDEVYKTICTIPKNELFDYVFAVLFKERRLFTSGEEMSRLLDKVQVDKAKELVVPECMNTVCFLKHEYSTSYLKGELDLDSLLYMSKEIAEKYDLLLPRACLLLEEDKLLISFAEFYAIVLANPKYFEIKEKIH